MPGLMSGDGIGEDSAVAIRKVGLFDLNGDAGLTADSVDEQR